MGEHGVGAARDRRYCQKEREPAYGQGHVGHARNQDDLSAHQPRIQAPRDTDIGSPFDDCPPIREEGEIVMVERDAQGKVVDAHFTERPQSCRQLLQIKWTRAFMKLYRITTAQADWYPAAALQIAKLALAQTRHSGSGGPAFNCLLVAFQTSREKMRQAKSGQPTRMRRAAATWREATAAVAGANTPLVSQVGCRPGGGSG